MSKVDPKNFTIFQSTPPVWVVTVIAQQNKDREDQISIHTTRVGGDAVRDKILSVAKISIHTTRVGGDIYGSIKKDKTYISIHTTRVGGDFLSFVVILVVVIISIHTTRVGGDFSQK